MTILGLKSIFTTLISASLAASQANAQDNAGPPISADARQAIGEMVEKGNNTMLILDKKQGQMITVENGRVVETGPALMGRDPGDSGSIRTRVTPAGIFALHEYKTTDKNYATGTFLAFECNDPKSPTVCLALHAVWNKLPSERRPQRLATPTADDNKISNGCVNVDAAYYQRIREFLSRNSWVEQNGAKQILRQPRFVILPEQAPVNSIFQPAP